MNTDPRNDARQAGYNKALEVERQAFLRDAARWHEISAESDRERVEAIRRAVAAGLTQREVAAAAGVSLGTVNAIVNNPTEIPQGWLREHFERDR
jgi:DNA-binding NarL/FixJ family response regulator